MSIDEKMQELAPPYIYFGGKRKVAPIVWQALGDVDQYVEPFYGGGSVMLLRPHAPRIETINDYDGFVSNFWRAVQAEPEAVADEMNRPVNECVPAGTMISTPRGDVPVEVVRAGMVVWGEHDGKIVPTTVTATRVSWANNLCRVGRLFLTGNHQVWTSRGYIPAIQLRTGDTIAILSGNGNRLDHLCVVRSENKSSALCRHDVAMEEAAEVQRTSLSRAALQEEDASGLLDMEPVAVGVGPNMEDAGEGQRGGLAAGGTKVDRQLRQPDKPHRRRGGHARVQGPPAFEIGNVGAAKGEALSSRPCAWYVRENTYAGSKDGDTKSSFVEAADGKTDARQDSGSSKGARYACGRGRIGCIPKREMLKRVAPSEDCISYNQSQTHRMQGNGRDVSVCDSSGKSTSSIGSVDTSISQGQVSVQGEEICASQPVWDLQTASGNLIANGVLIHNCDLEARQRWLCCMATPEEVRAGSFWTAPAREQLALWLEEHGTKTEFLQTMKENPLYYDAVRAGWWCWGINAWIGSGWCEGEWWPGVVGASKGTGVCDGANKRPHMGGAGQGVHRQLPHLGGAGQGEYERRGDVLCEWMRDLRDRLRNVRVCCGDWARICTDGAMAHGSAVGIFCDPPYSAEADRDNAIYRCEDDAVDHRVREWCIERTNAAENHVSCRAGGRYRIVLAGYEGEHNELEAMGWRVVEWKANGGFANFAKGDKGRDNAKRERLWLSPSCLTPHAECTTPLFGDPT
jgi:DNA adenine methylase